MNTELYKIEEGQLIIAKRIIEAIKEFEIEKKTIEEQEKQLREKLLEAMEKYGKDKWESPDGSLKVSYTPENESMIFDTARFKKDYLDLYSDYLKPSKRKASIRMTIKDEVNNAD